MSYLFLCLSPPQGKGLIYFLYHSIYSIWNIHTVWCLYQLAFAVQQTTPNIVPWNSNSSFSVQLESAGQFLSVLISAHLCWALSASVVSCGWTAERIIEAGVFHRFSAHQAVDHGSGGKWASCFLLPFRASSQSCYCGYLRNHMQRNYF